MRTYCLMLLSLLAGIFVLASQAQAQPEFHPAQSIELEFIRAETVVVGNVIAFEPNERNLGSRSVTLAVTETLKGEPTDRLVVAYVNNLKSIKEWVRQKRRLLVAIPPNPQPTNLNGRRNAFGLLDLDDSELALPGSDRVVLTSAKDVIEAARDASRRYPTAERIDAVTLPMSVGEKVGLHGDLINMWNGIAWNRREVEVPVEARLEEHALKWLQANDADTRIAGACALTFFKSDANVARLNAKLTDPAFDGNWNNTVRGYPVRQAANDVLKTWGLGVDSVVLQERLTNGQWQNRHERTAPKCHWALYRL